MSRIVMENYPLAVQQRIANVSNHLEAAFHGDWKSQAWLKQEALTTSDFPAIFQIINNAVVQAAWAKFTPGLWTKVSQRILRDNLKLGTFKTFDLTSDGLPPEAAGFARRPGSLPHVPELGQYPPIGFSSSSSSISVGKFGARFPFSWEAWREDDYDIIGKIPEGLVVLARRTEDTETFGVLLDQNGWNQVNFPAGATSAYLKANVGAGTLINDALSRQSLGAALAQAKKAPPANASGETYLNMIQKWALIVPPALAPVAEAILSATQLKVIDPVTGTEYLTPNTLAGKFEIVELPYIETMSYNSAYKDTMWGIVPLNGQGTNGPTLVTTFLRGEETPELRIKSEAGNALGGGPLDPHAGSFDNDAIDIRVRYFVGSYLTNREGTVLSKGTKAA